MAWWCHNLWSGTQHNSTPLGWSSSLPNSTPFRLFGSWLVSSRQYSSSKFPISPHPPPRVFVFVFLSSGFCLVLAFVAHVCYCLFFVICLLEFQIIRFVISTFTPIFFIEISFVLPPPPHTGHYVCEGDLVIRPSSVRGHGGARGCDVRARVRVSLRKASRKRV